MNKITKFIPPSNMISQIKVRKDGVSRYEIICKCTECDKNYNTSRAGLYNRKSTLCASCMGILTATPEKKEKISNTLKQGYKKDPTFGRRRKNKKYKCRRCKQSFIIENDKISTICNECKIKCVRCNIILTGTNSDNSNQRKNRYYCKACVAENVRNTRDKDKQKEYDLLRNYGITWNEYQILLESQNGCCWICKKSPTNYRLSVDHKHEKGEKRRSSFEIRRRVRGLLCWQCNTAIGKFNDDPIFLRQAAEYLEQTPAQHILVHKD